ncbi:arsenic resistance protein [Herbiconiux sp. YIM B11900]|uniref:arsenic resistance protein n=1 Tax=Herbiconiux sp. YIM B11900 TaxID=3404131 RepID=UPI003F8350E2
MGRAGVWRERHQVPLYLAAIALGGLLGVLAPDAAPGLGAVVTPALMLLLAATFLAVPLIEVLRSFRDLRFLGTVVVVNFVVAPLVAFGLTRFVADDDGLLLGALLVLLAPCIDYVIVFTGLAGGAKARLLAATPLLMLLQIVLLPLFLLLFGGGSRMLDLFDPAPFLKAFLLLIVVPLAAAALVQAIARRHPLGRAIENGAFAAMVPLMMLTLAVVVGSQLAAVGSEAATLLRLVPLYGAFLVVMTAVGIGAGRLAGLDAPGTRAVTLSGVTRNSLVVLPLALALPESLAIVPLAVVTQTLVELLGLVILVRVLPRICV